MEAGGHRSPPPLNPSFRCLVTELMASCARRYVHQADADVAERTRDHAQQDVGETRTAEPALQGDVHVPGGGKPAARSHADGVRVLQPQH